jgi:glycosyltransferase involved in cell wall biosynthesis
VTQAKGEPVEASVVIACKNEADHIGAMLASLARQTWDGAWEVVVADNGSTDGTQAIVESYAARLPRLAIVDASVAGGYALARNLGVEHAAGKKLLFVDGDDEVNDDYLRAMTAALDRTELVCARIGFDKLNEPALLDAWPARWQQDGPLRAFGFLPFAGGGTIGIRRSLFEEVAGFRQRRPSSQFEEADFCWRIQLAGHPAPTIVPDAVLHYRLPTAIGAMYRRGRNYARGRITLYELYGPHGMPHRPGTSFRDLAGAIWRIRRRPDVARAASVLGRFVGQFEGGAVS